MRNAECGIKAAARVVRDFGTNDVFVIAEKAGVKIVYEKWFPVTIGEFDKKSRTIVVNLNGGERLEKVIAHELGHFFAVDLKMDKKEEEKFAHAFAEKMLENVN